MCERVNLSEKEAKGEKRSSLTLKKIKQLMLKSDFDYDIADAKESQRCLNCDFCKTVRF
jgi:hypothetical protein